MLRVGVLLVMLATVALLGCPPEESGTTTCTTTVYDEDGDVLAQDTATGSEAGTAGCDGRVYLDSVGSDTTPAGVHTLFRFDSVGSDTVSGPE